MSSKKYWMQTYSGKAFEMPPTLDMICLQDIAHSLSMLCRYNGHINKFYSVGEHSILLSKWAEENLDKEHAKAALLQQNT